MAPSIAAYDPDKKIKVSLVRVTPPMAEEWLHKNKRNRPIVNSLHAKYARDMSSRRWRVTSDTIKFDPTGQLIDGQHRLWACIDAGVPFETYVAWGVSSDAFDVIDTGRRRSASDMLALKGEVDPLKLSGAASLLWKFNKGILQKSVPIYPTTREIGQALEEHPRLRDSVVRGKALKHLCSGAIASFCHYLFSQKDLAMADAFFERLATGEELPSGSPVLVLRERLQKNRSSIAKIRQRDLVILFIKAWNMYRDGKKAGGGKLWIMKGKSKTAEAEFPKIK